MDFQIFGKKSEPAQFEGIYFPASDLAQFGLGDDAENSEDVGIELRRDRLTLGLVDALTAHIVDLPPELRLGLSANRPNFQSLNWKFELTFQGFAGFDSPGGIKPLPLPREGKNANLGEVAVSEIFPNAKKLAASVQVSQPGILIASAALRPYWGGSHADLSLSGDGRAVLWALWRWICGENGPPKRGAGEKSAIVAKTTTAPVIARLTPPTGAGVGPVHGLTADQLKLGAVLTFSASIAFSLELSRDKGRSWDVNCSAG